jgi:hypothetical protein
MTEIGVDPFAERARIVLEKERGTGLGLKCEHTASRTFSEFYRTRDARGFRTGDLIPAHDQRGVHKSGAGEHAPCCK